MVMMALAAVPTPLASRASVPADTLPARLSDQAFWKLSAELSEPNGYFRSENLVSNEHTYQYVIPALTEFVKPGGVYLGVAPDQNFTYMAALRPRIAFILDIRRGNLHAQLLYKALFALSTDRAEFVSRLFTKPRPEALGNTGTAREIMDAYWDQPSGTLNDFKQNLDEVFDVLIGAYELPLSVDDRAGIEYVYRSFYWFGPGITWSSSRPRYSTDPSGNHLPRSPLRYIRVSGSAANASLTKRVAVSPGRCR